MEISIKSEITRFYEFLNQEDNSNIIFSGKFGIGKTYFINKFFEEYNTKYTYLYLSPVNYSIASNEDIFEYIKVNILLQLLEKTSVELDSIEYKFTDVAYCYLKNNFDSFFQSLFGLASNIADLADESHVSIASKFVQFCLSLKGKVDLYVNNQSISDLKNITTFIQSISNNKGSLFEYDIITQLINRIIDKIKKPEDSKPIILVIDDLDRIDPEHIFRILNILSAHNNHCYTNNHKFGIDKTILVCDIINIRHIYKNKYGMDVDFNGYIDKFYSKEVFHFTNVENVIKETSGILLSMKSDYENDLLDPHDFSYKACYALLSAFLKNDSLKLRTLLKIKEKNYNNIKMTRISNRRIPRNNFVSLSVLDFLRTIFASIEDLEESITNLMPKDVTPYEKDISICFIALSDYENNKFEPGIYHLMNGIEYMLQNSYSLDLVFNTEEFWNKNKDNISAIEILKAAFRNYKENFQE